MNAEKFISEPIKPVIETADTSQMAIGGPGLPREFLWDGRRVRIAAILRTWRETGKCTHGSGENYVRKHWFEVKTSAGIMKIYFERKARGKAGSPRWRIFSLRES